MVEHTAPIRRPNSSFVLFLGIVVAAIVFYGFSFTTDETLIHYKSPPAPILYVHVLLSSAWLILFIIQSAFVRTGDIRRHRQLGVAGLALGTAVAIIGFATVIIMRQRSVVLHHGSLRSVAFLSIPLLSLTSFAAPFFLAAMWRKRPDLHRRLMVLATCSLTGAALSRIPWLGGPWGPIVTYGLMIAAAVEDGFRNRRPHPVYLIGIPALFAASVFAIYLFAAAPPIWLAIAGLLLKWL